MVWTKLKRLVKRVVPIAVLALLPALAALAGPQSLPALFPDPRPFERAIAKERPSERPSKQLARQPSATVTGLTVPHHLLAADLIARGFWAASPGHYDRILILSPDHFNRSKKPFATTRADMDTAFGRLRNDRVATGALVEAGDLFEESRLFDKEHGVAAVAPFVRYFFPRAKIIPVAISYGASETDFLRAYALFARLMGPHTLVVQSTDFSHYLTAAQAEQRDQETLDIIAANDPAAALRLSQPAHVDSRAAFYLQMRLQKEALQSFGTVVANRNSADYAGLGQRTTSYVVVVYTTRQPVGRELTYPDQQRLFFGGDFFAGRWLSAPLADPANAREIVATLKDLTGGAPMVVNLEGLMMAEPPEGAGDPLHVMHAQLALPLLKSLNVVAAGLANNHSSDLGAEGLEESRDLLRKGGVTPIGQGEMADLGQARVLALNFIGKFDAHDYPVTKDGDFDALCQHAARTPLIALVHWGREYSLDAGPAEKAAAERLFSCGVGAIVGAHNHVAANGVEAPRGGEGLMVYSLGNMLFDQTAARASGALLELRFFKQGTFASRLIPLPNLFDLARVRGNAVTPPADTNSAHNRPE